MKVRATLAPIRGVIHSAAVYSDTATPGFADKSLDSMRQVWGAKVDGLETLHAVFKADALDFFVSFSSMTGLVPHLARGASDYAMANTFVEHFSAFHSRQDGNGRYKSIVWSDWNETGGMTRIDKEKAAAIGKTFDRLGMRTFSNREGRLLFEKAMTGSADSHVIVGYLDRTRFDDVAPSLLYANPDGRESDPPAVPARLGSPLKVVPGKPILNHIEQWESEKRSGAEVTVERITDVVSLEEIRTLDPSLIRRLHALMFGRAPNPAPSTGQLDYAQAITATVMGVLKLKTVSPEQPLQNYGLDSISATVLATRLEKMLNVEIRPQWLIEFPTIEKLSRHLTAQAERP